MKSGAGKALTIAIAVCSFGAIAWFVLAPQPKASPVATASSDGEPSSARARGPDATGAPSTTAAPTPSLLAPLEVNSAEPAPTSLPPYTGPVRDRARADRLREALAALVAGKQGDDETMPSPVGSGNQAKEALGQYVNTVMQEQFVPLAGSCYEALLEANPNAQGAVTLDFSIVGDRSVGGVVLDVEVELAKGLKVGDFETCMRESMYSVVFAAPPGEDGTVSVTQSFELSP